MIKKNITNKTTICRLETREGETIEAKVRRVMSNNEPIHDEAPLIYTERKDGINPDYDIRSDRFDYALDEPIIFIFLFFISSTPPTRSTISLLSKS